MANRIGPMDQSSLGKIGEKIGDNASTQKVSADKPASGSDVRKPAETNDTVNLTSSAKLLERLEKTLAGLPEIDAARVADVKTAIENGDYKVDADKIAEAMLRLDRELGD